MPETQDMKIFYFNINFTCNSKCLFCWSHNTSHDSYPRLEIPPDFLIGYLNANSFSPGDKVILNGGEALIHSQFMDILLSLRELDAETLIYTNGRLLNKLNLNALDKRSRFIVPFHGSQKIHDSITRIPGSWQETFSGTESFRDAECLLDMKIIINSRMIQSFTESLEELSSVYFNNALHITSMAETPVSQQNNFLPLSLSDSARYTAEVFRTFMDRVRIIKIYDTCVAGLADLLKVQLAELNYLPEVFYCDYSQNRRVILQRQNRNCSQSCSISKCCISEVSEMKVLEYSGGKFYENLE